MPDVDATQLRCYEVYDYFVANREQLLSENFLYEFLKPHCLFKRLRMRGSHLRIVQLPREFAQFLVFMGERAITSYLEVGTSTGGSFLITDSYLRAISPGYRKSIGYDRRSKLRDFRLYQERFPTCVFRHCHSKNMSLAEDVDMSFIDATHKRHWVWHDFRKVKDHSRFVAFHDIVLRGATVDSFWREVKSRYESWEFVDTSLPETCGIGVLKLS